MQNVMDVVLLFCAEDSLTWRSGSLRVIWH